MILKGATLESQQPSAMLATRTGLCCRGNSVIKLFQQHLSTFRHACVRSPRIRLPLIHRDRMTVKAASSQPSNFIQTVQTKHGELELKLPVTCPGCGIRIQNQDPDKPGYYPMNDTIAEKLIKDEALRLKENEPELENVTEDLSQVDDDKKDEGSESLVDDETLEALDRAFEAEEEKEKITYVVEDYDDTLPILCSRCYSLKHYGKVKSTLGEMLLPEFDICRKLGQKIALQKGRNTVVLCVVDITDFDGSLPREALRNLIPNEKGHPGMACKLILAVNKIDLLPKTVRKTRLDIWVRTRARHGGLPPLTSVHLVSSFNMVGVEGLLQDAVKQVGVRGDLWVVGAQNAGKSSLINALKKTVGTDGRKDLTAASLPGTTLGIVEVKGLPMPRKCSVYDTPGVRHNYQLTSIVNSSECKMLLPQRIIIPRTFRAAEGYSVLVAGLARLDIVLCPSASLYLTFWGAEKIQCHLGKTEGVEERRFKFAGTKLQPPENMNRVDELGPFDWVDIDVTGTSWKQSSKDICFAGLGWFGIGVKGTAKFRAHTLYGGQITIRNSLMPDFAVYFEVPGFSRTVKVGGTGGKWKKGWKKNK